MLTRLFCLVHSSTHASSFVREAEIESSVQVEIERERERGKRGQSNGV